MNKIIIVFALYACAIGGFIQAEDIKMYCKNGACSLEDDAKPTTEPKKNSAHDGAVVQLTDDNFDTVIKQSSKPVIVDFYATWCPPCKQVKPIFAELARSKKDFIFAAVDVDASPKIMAQCGIQAMPTFVIFKNGEQWGSVQGALPKEQLLAEFKKIIATDRPVAGAQVDRTQQLIMAIVQKNIDAVKKMIDDGVDVNGTWQMPGQDKVSPLLIAIIGGTKDIIDCLMDAGAVMNATVEKLTKKHIDSIENQLKYTQYWFDYAKHTIADSPQSMQRTVTVGGREVLQQLMVAMKDPVMLKKFTDEYAGSDVVFQFGSGQATPLYVAIILKNKQAIDMRIAAGESFAIEVISQQGDKKTVAAVIEDDLKNYRKAVTDAHELLTYALKKAQ